MKKSPPLISVVIPVYNVEEYLRECLDSVLDQDIEPEVIAIDDGSTDGSGVILEEYEMSCERIKVIRQKNKGLSAARNTGLEEARGRYVLFVDSDDCLERDSLGYLCREAEKYKADLVVGNMGHLYPDKKITYPYARIGDELIGKVYTGEACFIQLMRHSLYQPMACMYLYRREWLKQKGLKFSSVVHEDELWSPVVMCQAPRALMTQICFYHYRQREGSITRSTHPEKRIEDICYISKQLAVFASRYSWDNEVKGWLWVLVYRLYSIAFACLFSVKHSGFIVPDHQLYTLFQIRKHLTSLQYKGGYLFYKKAREGIRTFFRWRLSPFFIKPSVIEEDKSIILIYNTLWRLPLHIPVNDIPPGILYTTDRACFNKAGAVVFHLPDLLYEMEEDLEKPVGQLWVAWNQECEHHYPWMDSPEIKELFDVYMDYHPQSEIVHPYYYYDYPAKLTEPVDNTDRSGDICMLISGNFNQNGRIEYLEELMKYIPIDSYGRLSQNKILVEDEIREETRNRLYRKYKFVIAFENAVCNDYVTEKFYIPLLAGAVPVYLGAPNIGEFSPGKNCFVDVTMFKNPCDLAKHLNDCLKNPDLYEQYQAWRKIPLKEEFIKKTEEVKTNPFIRLARLVKEKNKS